MTKQTTGPKPPTHDVASTATARLERAGSWGAFGDAMRMAGTRHALGLPFYLKTGMEGSLNACTVNVRALAAKRKQAQLHRLLTERGLDVLAIQETKIDRNEETATMADRFTLRYYACISHAVSSSAGCVLFVEKLPGLVVETETSYDSGRLVICDILYHAVSFRMICVYAPNRADERTIFCQPETSLNN